MKSKTLRYEGKEETEGAFRGKKIAKRRSEKSRHKKAEKGDVDLDIDVKGKGKKPDFDIDIDTKGKGKKTGVEVDAKAKAETRY